MWRILHVLVALTPLAGVLDALPTAAWAASPRNELRIGFVGNTAMNWPIYIMASRRGERSAFLFRDIKPELNFVRFEKFGDALDALASGAIDVWAPALTERVLNAIARGTPIIISGGYMNKAPYRLVTRKSIRNLGELSEKTIGVSAFMPAQEKAMLGQLTAQGLKYRKNYALLPAKGGSIGKLFGLAAKSFDAAYIHSEVLHVAGSEEVGLFKADQDFHVYGRKGDFPKFPYLVMAFNEKWARLNENALTKMPNENADLVTVFLDRFSSSIQWLYDPANRDQALEILIQETGFELGAARAIYRDFVNFRVFAEKSRLDCDGIAELAERIFSRSKSAASAETVINRVLLSQRTCSR